MMYEEAKGMVKAWRREAKKRKPKPKMKFLNMDITPYDKQLTAYIKNEINFDINALECNNME